jgi:hypothetical protein
MDFQSEFKNHVIYQNLLEDYDELIFDWAWHDLHWNSSITPRKFSATTRFSAVPFYYLKFLTDQNPENIYDLGCGWNIFKKYIPNIIGVGPEDPGGPAFHADIYDFIDDAYVGHHQNYFESIFSINALHFHPLSSLPKIVNDFFSMVQPGGRGFLALNLQRMLDRDPIARTLSFEDIQKFVYTSVTDQHPNLDYQVIDIDLSVRDEYMNGNIRLVCHKTI